ncbi:MAG TPA: hypothetical protein VNN76_09955 [Bacteroidota bacterium]|nr:hypothetical protein [Bacteroidota bacterium]
MRTHITVQQKLVGVLTIFFLIFMGGCELVDPSDVENPQITADNLFANPNGGTTSLVTGMRRYFSAMIGISSFIGDLVSDNLDNRTSFYANELSFPRTIKPTTFTYGDVYDNAQRLNALGLFGVNTIIPNDALATNEQRAEVYFYRGMGLLILAEFFTNFPILEKGPLVTAADALNEALTQFNTALSLTNLNPMRVNCRLARARAYRLLGDKTNAAAEANAALALPGGTNHVFSAQFDPANLTATTYAAMVGRTSNDIQPNPRLDFLDPKFTTNATAIPVLKSEEAHLILAEIALSNNDLAGAKASMRNAVTLARSRTTGTFNDRDSRTGRPNDPAMTVRADSASTPVAGLIQRRGGTSIVTTYPISYTYLTTTMIDALVTKAEHIHTLFLLRQHIFFLEGRRMTDLGIRLPVTQRQIDGNPNVVAGGPGTTVVVPSYIPPTDEMRHFSVSGLVVTIKWDMNKVIAANISSVSPLGITP